MNGGKTSRQIFERFNPYKPCINRIASTSIAMLPFLSKPD
jgi:hypothetical protein